MVFPQDLQFFSVSVVKLLLGEAFRTFLAGRRELPIVAAPFDLTCPVDHTPTFLAELKSLRGVLSQAWDT